MSDKPRRSNAPVPPEMPSGYRSTRRGSKVLKQAKKAEKQHKVATAVQRTTKSARNAIIVVLQAIAAAGFALLVLLLAAMLVNTLVRWNAQRLADNEGSAAERERRSRENVVIIGANGEDPVGFLALRVDRKGKQIFGIAIPDGAFIDVPGQGFSRIGDAYPAGPDVVVAGISNYLAVPVTKYVVVPANVYRDAVRRQVVRGIPEAASKSNLSEEELRVLSAEINDVSQENVALVPMPVKPIKLGNETYFEPQKAEIADLLKSWWNVDPAKGDEVTKVVVYNGAGVPGIAGEAAQQLIRSGYRVVDTQNADRFDYPTTKIVVRHGNKSTGEGAAKVLGVGEVEVDPSSETVTDLVVIIGKDYRPPASGSTEGK